MPKSDKIKKFTVLHSNDIHGDFFPEPIVGKKECISGGVSLLSGYLNKVNGTEKNVIFTISGDIVHGSIIDSEYKGVSSIEIINYLSPDVVSLGNHELDYGLPHLFFLEKMANFPIINANLYIKKYHKRLFRPYFKKKIDGIDILFIGIITELVLQSLKMDRVISTLIDLADAVDEIGKICEFYKNDDIDLTIILTHIGFETDKQLASMLNPDWGVDMILGGHSHTYLTEPALINNILIAQSGTGTDQIGRFDILVNEDTNSIIEWEWKLVEINNQSAKPDDELDKFIDTYTKDIDKNYSSLICRLDKKLTHPYREYETSLGNFLADIVAEITECEIVLIGSGSICVEEFGPVVTLQKILEMLPYDGNIVKLKVTGSQLNSIFSFILCPDNCHNYGECFQVNKNVKVIYDRKFRQLISFYVNEKPVQENAEYFLGIQGYHFENCKSNLNITQDELTSRGGKKVTTTSLSSLIEEYLRRDEDINCPEVEGRLRYIH